MKKKKKIVQVSSFLDYRLSGRFSCAGRNCILFSLFHLCMNFLSSNETNNYNRKKKKLIFFFFHRETFSIPLVPLGLKETKDVDFTLPLKVNFTCTFQNE